MVLLECMGTADPGTLIPMFWQDEALESKVYLDGLITLVDAKNICSYLKDERRDQVIRQIAFADRIILNKTDLGICYDSSFEIFAVSQLELDNAVCEITKINAAVDIIPTSQSHVDLTLILNIKYANCISIHVIVVL